SQPLIVTSCPSYFPACSIVIVAIARFSIEIPKIQFTRDTRSGPIAAALKEGVFLAVLRKKLIVVICGFVLLPGCHVRNRQSAEAYIPETNSVGFGSEPFLKP